MSKKLFVSAILLAAFFLSNAESASAKSRYIHSVKFVCGYNPTNVGLAGEALDKREGEPTVKFGNYATDINIFNYNIYGFPGSTVTVTYLEKQVILLVDRGVPVGREPRIARPTGFDFLELPFGTATMDDCNRIAEMLWGAVPSPFPLTIGFLVIGSTDDIDVTAVYTAQTCAKWADPAHDKDLQCLDASGKLTSASVSIEVDQIESRKIAD